MHACDKKQLQSGKCVHVVKFFNMRPIFSTDYRLLVGGIICVCVCVGVGVCVCEENSLTCGPFFPLITTFL